MERGKGANGEQFKRYRDALPNWILTDYLEFRWFVAGEKRLTVRVGDLDDRRRILPATDGAEQLERLLQSFFTQPAFPVDTAKELAQRMEGMTSNLRDIIVATFQRGDAKDKNWLENWLNAFREVLIPDLDEAQFADMFAQTLAYGLFAAKVHAGSGKPFSRDMAARSLPRTNPFLRKLFEEFGGVDMPQTFDWAVDDIVELLKHAAMDEVLKYFGEGKGKQDPVVHFYETFLAAYNPKLREMRGVYYTPEPVVSYIVRSIDYLLKTRFARPKGLADENTLILDPATGTATFLYFVIQQVYAQFASQRGAWDSYVAQHLLNRLFGFELLMAPYAIAHLKLGMELQRTGYSFGSEQRLGVYLTNTLEEAAKKSEKLFAQWISEEANAAAEIKRDRPILVVLGNPPYSGHSANRSRDEEGKLTFIGQLIEDYKKVDGRPLGEKNPKWLQDDYVKFIRFAQWRIERTGYGVLGFITNHGYLDNPTFRGMRQQLMRCFSDIYVYNLHGNSKKKERAPDG
ncbi:MAG TPA: N-6 DNA methylase, partial [Terriglobia bacterium]|nr:N-6 DNA methylase [Terriglobia bacterium]